MCRVGKIRIIVLAGAIANANTGVYYNGLPTGDVPAISTTYSHVFYQKNNQNYPGYVQVSGNVVVGRFYTIQSSAEISSWPTYGSIVYLV